MKLVFLGPPGAGKGTMASRLSRHMNIPHISTGDIIRAAIRNETELGNQVKDIVEGGGLVPDDLTIELVEERLKFDDTREGYILDGFPRTIVQAEALENMEKIDHVINFELSDEEIIRRLSGRRVHKPTGRTYHVMFNPPKVEGKDDVTGEDLIIRPDDREEAVAKRLSIYREQTEPLIQYYQKKSLLEHLEGGARPDDVWCNFHSLINNPKPHEHDPS
jgi:adenylate kinase